MKTTYKAVPVLWKDVAIAEDSFWGQRQKINRKITIPLEYKLNKKNGVFKAYQWDWWDKRKGKAPWRIWVGDLSKWIEAASYAIALNYDEKLAVKIKEAINCLIQGQKENGYLYPNPMMKEQVFANLQEYHELYEIGHDIEGAVAYFQATGKRNFLNAICKTADLLCRVFGRGKGQKRGYDGHPEIELALVKLYKTTGNEDYLKLAKFFVEERGRKPYYFKKEMALLRKKGLPFFGWYKDEQWYWYCQAHKPVREQDEAAGHAVRLLYLYSGVADVAAITGDAGLLSACKRVWKNIITRRMYITGGVGSFPDCESFTFDYDLPDENAYAETCASIALVFFAHRMLHIELDSQYSDVMEKALYNGVLSGVGIDGKSFFYANPLAVYPEALKRVGSHRAGIRQKWFGCACCPPNIARLLASLGGYIYSVSDNTIYVHLYVEGESNINLCGRDIRINQKTNYPWDGKIRLLVHTNHPSEFSMAVRIPGWCRNAAVMLNNKKVDLKEATKKGYAYLLKKWEDGDVIELNFPMPVECVEAHPAVRMNAGKVALQRGPLIYCLEEVDNGKNLADISLIDRSDFKLLKRNDIKGGYIAIEGEAKRRVIDSAWRNVLYRTNPSKEERIKFAAIPYHLWANRRAGEMRVWVNY